MQWSQVFIVLALCVASVFAGCPGSATCKPVGQACTTSNDCAFGLYCAGSTCQNTKSQKTPCTSDAECAYGLNCIAEPNTCSNTPTPKWLEGKPLNEWFNIPNTQGAGGSFVDVFSGFAYNEWNNEIWIGATGGHHDSSDNRVVSMLLSADSPQWVTRMAASTNVSEDVAYYPDGKPTSRHTYRQMYFIPQINRLMLFGNIGVWGNGGSYTNTDGFNAATNTWDPPGTYPDSAYYVGGAIIRATGEVFSIFGHIFSPTTLKWSLPTFYQIETMRFPIAHDSLRNQFYNLQIGDGQGYDGPKIHSTRIPVKGTSQYNVTFNPSTALNMFIAENPVYAAMDYDVDNDRFLFYSGIESAAGRIYVIKPNSGNVWDMSLFEYGPNSIPVTPVTGAGINGRFRYIPAYKGFLLLPRTSDNLFFMRTSNASCTSANGYQRTCLPTIKGPGMPCTQDGECFYFNSTINSKQLSPCELNKKCYGLPEFAGKRETQSDLTGCTGNDQCNLGLVCKSAMCSKLATAGQACASQVECMFGLTCMKTSKDATAKSCVAPGQGASGSYCEDTAFCGDGLYCDTTSKTCMNGAGSDNCPNPTGFNKIISNLTVCYSNNLPCQGAILCDNCFSEVCALYALAPQYTRALCQDAPYKKTFLESCPVQPTTTTSGASSSKTTTSGGATNGAGSSTGGAAATSTTGSPVDSAATLVSASVVLVLSALLLI